MLLNVEFADDSVRLETLRMQPDLCEQSLFPTRGILAGRSGEPGQGGA